MTRDQMGKCIELDREGWRQVPLPTGAETPIPGRLLFAKPDHRELLLLQPDGTTVDLLALHRAAEDLIRNWGKGSALPKFIGDWRRLILLANVLNGAEDPAPEPK